MRRRLSPEGDQTAGIPADLVTYEVLTVVPKTSPAAWPGRTPWWSHNPLPRETLERADRLRIVSRHGVGTDNVDVAFVLGKILWPSPSTPTWGPWPNTRS
ncbi:MAG: hypothetical protein ACLTTU_02965 [Bilophila wadsworthia]